MAQDGYDRLDRRKVMSNKIDPKTGSSHPMVYQIRIKGQLGHEWTDWFEGLAITLEENGDTLFNRPDSRPGRVVWIAKKSA